MESNFILILPILPRNIFLYLAHVISDFLREIFVTELTFSFHFIRIPFIIPLLSNEHLSDLMFFLLYNFV